METFHQERSYTVWTCSCLPFFLLKFPAVLLVCQRQVFVCGLEGDRLKAGKNDCPPFIHGYLMEVENSINLSHVRIFFWLSYSSQPKADFLAANVEYVQQSHFNLHPFICGLLSMNTFHFFKKESN